MSEWLTGRGIKKGEEKKTEREEKTLDHSSASLSTSSPPLSLSLEEKTDTDSRDHQVDVMGARERAHSRGGDRRGPVRGDKVVVGGRRALVERRCCCGSGCCFRPCCCRCGRVDGHLIGHRFFGGRKKEWLKSSSVLPLVGPAEVLEARERGESSRPSM
jgi:hypothetical protein